MTVTKDEFNKFIERASAEPPSDRALLVELDQWRLLLQQLWGQIEGFLAEYVQQNMISIRRRTKSLTEQQVGSYSVEQLEITIGTAGRRVVRLEPIGTFLIGTKGRVDMTGPRGTVRIVLVDKAATKPTVKVSVKIRGLPEEEREADQQRPPEWTWKLVDTQPFIHYEELTSETFLKALMAVAQ